MTTLELSELLASGAPEWLLIVAALLLLTRVVAAVLDGLPKLLDALNRRAATRAALRPDAHADLRAAALAVLDVHDDTRRLLSRPRARRVRNVLTGGAGTGNGTPFPLDRLRKSESSESHRQ